MQKKRSSGPSQSHRASLFIPPDTVRGGSKSDRSGWMEICICIIKCHLQKENKLDGGQTKKKRNNSRYKVRSADLSFRRGVSSSRRVGESKRDEAIYPFSFFVLPPPPPIHFNMVSACWRMHVSDSFSFLSDWDKDERGRHKSSRAANIAVLF